MTFLYPRKQFMYQNVGQWREERWVFGAVERRTRRCFLVWSSREKNKEVFSSLEQWREEQGGVFWFGAVERRTRMCFLVWSSGEKNKEVFSGLEQ